MPERKELIDVALPLEAEARCSDADTLSEAKSVSVKRLATLMMVQS